MADLIQQDIYDDYVILNTPKRNQQGSRNKGTHGGPYQIGSEAACRRALPLANDPSSNRELESAHKCKNKTIGKEKELMKFISYVMNPDEKNEQ